MDVMDEPASQVDEEIEPLEEPMIPLYPYVDLTEDSPKKSKPPRGRFHISSDSEDEIKRPYTTIFKRALRKGKGTKRSADKGTSPTFKKSRKNE